MNYNEKIANKYLLLNLHLEIYKKLYEEVCKNDFSYSRAPNSQGRPYQSYDFINFKGLRWSVEKRIKDMELEKFYNKKSSSFDIGCNFGFFVNEFSRYFNDSSGCDHVKEFIEIGKIVNRYLCKITKKKLKVNLFCKKFEDLNLKKKYDFITSLAAYQTTDKYQRGNPNKYFEKIDFFLKKKGIFIFESVSYPKNSDSPDFANKKNSESAYNKIKKLFNLRSVEEKKSGQYYRLFIEAEKK